MTARSLVAEPGPSTVESDEPLLGVLGTLGRLAQVHDRPELVEAVEAAQRRLTSTVFRVVVLGEFKKGKTSLVNALVNAHVGAVDDDIATAAPMEVGYTDSDRAHVWRIDDDGEEHHEEIEPADAARASVDPNVVRVRVGVPRPLLQSGLVLVDTPGVGGIGSAAAVVSASTLAEAHAAIVVTDTAQELTAAELDALVDVTQRTSTVVLVETKTDLHPSWRRIVEADVALLAERGLDVPVVAVSSHLRNLALVRGDKELNAESGYPRLVDLVRTSMIASARTLIRADAAAAARRIHAHLRQPLAAELDALSVANGVDAKAAVAAAQTELVELRERMGTWPQILADGMVDLTNEVDLHLREAMKALLVEMGEAIDAVDPAETWEELEPSVHRRVAEVLDANLAVLRDGSTALADRLGECIREEVSVVGDGDGLLAAVGGLGDVTDGVEWEKATSTERGFAARAQQAFRSGYGGAMPIMVVGGMVLGVVGLGTLVMPLAGVAGAAAGRRAMRDERERNLRQRRQQAKAALKQYLDETAYRASNERRAALRRVQRSLRDHCTARAKEIVATHQQTLQRAEANARSSEDDRRRRLGELQQEIARVDAAIGVRGEGHR